MEKICSKGDKNMSKMNLVVLAGNLVRDPELRYTPSGAAICEFTIANNETWVTDGEKKEKVNFVNCTCWGKRGEVINEYFSKGKEIEVQGKLDFQQWETKEGEKRNQLKVKVEQFFFQGSKADSNGGGSGEGRATNAQEPVFPAPKQDVDEAEIPF
jgi:single-strand DNA-binding protein